MAKAKKKTAARPKAGAKPKARDFKQVAAYFNDRWTTSDALDFEDYRVALEQIILNADTPITIGVFGPWGSGKTSLLKMLEEGIRERGGGYTFRPAWFTAWKYNQQDALWRAFLLRVIDSLYPRDETTGERIPEDDLKGDQAEGVRQLDRMASSLYQQVVWAEETGWALNKGALKLQAAKLPAWLILRLFSQGEAAKELGITPEMGKVIEREAREFHLHQLESMEQFEKSFEDVLKLILGEDGRLVVFVDDLDRCLPEKALEVLEAIKLFLNVEGTVFVLGMDREIVTRGIEQHYREFFLARAEDGQRTELPVTGDAYLQKLVQVPVNLPLLEVEARLKFIEDLEKDQEPALRMDDLTRQVFARGLLPNPRQVKRALNIFGLLKTVALQREERQKTPEDMKIAWPRLAKTVLIQSQWPEFYALWRQMPTLVQELEAQYESRPTTDEDIIFGLQEENLAIESDPDEPATERYKGLAIPLKPSESPSELRERGARTRTVQQTGVLADFLNQRSKYALLARLLTFPPRDKPGFEQARFAGLSRNQLRVYLGLAGSVQDEASAQEVEAPRLEQARLDTSDPALLREQVARLLDAGTDREKARERVRQMLLGAMTDATIPAAARAAAGNLLAEQGDPRFDPDFHYLPKDERLGFINIPAGRFKMGSDPQKDEQAYEGEQPQHELGLPEYYIARWPVTAAQYRAFVQASGHKTGDEDSLKGVDNHPVNWVYWRDALAYCEWLHGLLEKSTETPEALRRALAAGWRVTLPSEAEWEKAARGMDGRIYPWEGEFDANRANTEESEIGGTSAVGCFPGGRSPYGVEDLSGNVWEWTRSKWGKDFNKPEFKYPYAVSDGREGLEDKNILRVLRGGSFNDGAVDARCAYRLGLYPEVRNWFRGFRLALSPAAPAAGGRIPLDSEASGL